MHRDASKASPEIQNAVDSEVKRLIEVSLSVEGELHDLESPV